jgi:hypothetical protein
MQADRTGREGCLRSSGKDQHMPQVYWQCLNYNGKGQLTQTLRVR